MRRLFNFIHFSLVCLLSTPFVALQWSIGLGLSLGLGHGHSHGHGNNHCNSHGNSHSNNHGNNRGNSHVTVIHFSLACLLSAELVDMVLVFIMGSHGSHDNNHGHGNNHGQ